MRFIMIAKPTRRPRGGVAEPGERGDVRQRPGLGVAAPARDVGAQPVRQRAAAAHDRQRRLEGDGEVGLVHRADQVDDVVRADAVAPREPRAVDERRPGAEPLDGRAHDGRARAGAAREPEARAEALQQLLGHVVVRRRVGAGDERRHRGRGPGEQRHGGGRRRRGDRGVGDADPGALERSREGLRDVARRVRLEVAEPVAGEPVVVGQGAHRPDPVVRRGSRSRGRRGACRTPSRRRRPGR